MISAFLLTASLNVFSQAGLNIVPMPAEIKMGKGMITIDKNTVIVLEGSGLEKTAAYFNDLVKKRNGLSFKVVNSYSGNNAIRLNYERLDNELPGAYLLNINDKGVYIAGDNAEGVFYGIQTLLQLITSKKQVASIRIYDSKNEKPETTNLKPQTTNILLTLPQLSLTDRPRFAYRGMHLDVGRHLFPVEFIKKYIDYLATYKYNTFHWHLTEDQGWRIEIKKYPLLTQVGACRDQTLVGRYGSNIYDGKRYCGYYTQEEVKAIVQYAADRHITVIPEIEMPGHSTAALASYPYLGCTKGPYKVMDTWGVLDDVYCAGNDSTFTFLQDVLDEVLALFPSTYIHIGGDECPKERWKKCQQCQKRIKDEKLKDEHALQSYFIQRIEKYLNKKGRRIIGWDEILEGGLAPNATVMSWRGEEGGIEAAKLDHDVIMTPGSHCYFDHAQSANEDSLTIGGYLPLEKVYAYEPVPAVLNAAQAKHVLGAQGNVWTEYMEYPEKVEYMIFPRMMALSEVLWSPKSSRNWSDFEKRLPVMFKRLEEQGCRYSKAYYDLVPKVLPTANFEGVQYQLQTRMKNYQIRYMEEGEMGKKPGSQTGNHWENSQIYQSPILVNKKSTLVAATFKEKERMSTIIRQSFHFNKATGRKISLVNPPSKNYPGNGAFTLVDGVQNLYGLSRSSEYLGFLGTDLDATIDLKTNTNISKLVLHVLDQNGSWIYLPSQVEITYLPDADLTDEVMKNAPKVTKLIDPIKNKGTKTITIEENQKCRYIRVVARNFGMIPSGNPGAGNKAWLFVDEIEVE